MKTPLRAALCALVLLAVAPAAAHAAELSMYTFDQNLSYDDIALTAAPDCDQDYVITGSVLTGGKTVFRLSSGTTYRGRIATVHDAAIHAHSLQLTCDGKVIQDFTIFVRRFQPTVATPKVLKVGKATKVTFRNDDCVAREAIVKGPDLVTSPVTLKYLGGADDHHQVFGAILKLKASTPRGLSSLRLVCGGGDLGVFGVRATGTTTVKPPAKPPILYVGFTYASKSPFGLDDPTLKPRLKIPWDACADAGGAALTAPAYSSFRNLNDTGPARFVISADQDGVYFTGDMYNVPGSGAGGVTGIGLGGQHVYLQCRDDFGKVMMTQPMTFVRYPPKGTFVRLPGPGLTLQANATVTAQVVLPACRDHTLTAVTGISPALSSSPPRDDLLAGYTEYHHVSGATYSIDGVATGAPGSYVWEVGCGFFEYRGTINLV